MKLPQILSARRSNIRPGLYHYVRNADGATARFHLRADAGGGGLLLANAAAMARLTPSGVIIAKGLLDGDSTPEITQNIRSSFRQASSAQVSADIEAVKTLIAQMESPDGTYPILNLSDPAFSPKAMPPVCPISADVPLCTPARMKQIFQRLWEIGIPHATIIVAREPDEKTLIESVEHAGDLGMIAGVRGRAGDLGQGDRLSKMIAAGLDHIDVFTLSDSAELHDSLAGAGDYEAAMQTLAAAKLNEICPVAQLALVRPTLAAIQPTLESLANHGLKDVGLFAIASTDADDAQAGAMLAHELPPAARFIEELAERLKLRLIWQPTVRFDRRIPLAEQVCRGPRCAGDGAIRVEPDGLVIPPRGPFRPAGNLLQNDWLTIQRSEAYQNYLARVTGDTHCDSCPGLAICAADCPREPAGWAS